MSDWVMLVPSFVFSRIKGDFSQKLKDQYGMTGEHFSTVNRKTKETKFPTILVQNLPSVEQGADLEGSTINAGLFSFQVDVFDNRSQGRTREVMTEVVRIMKEMRFQVVAMPEFEASADGTYRCTARFRRLIGSGDVL